MNELFVAAVEYVNALNGPRKLEIDRLKMEVEESRRALDEIRHEVEEACVLSQRFYYQE